MKTPADHLKEMAEHLAKPEGCTPCIAALAVTLIRVAKSMGAHDLNILSALRAAAAYQEQHFLGSDQFQAWEPGEGAEFMKKRREADTGEKLLKLILETASQDSGDPLYVAVGLAENSGADPS